MNRSGGNSVENDGRKQPPSATQQGRGRGVGGASFGGGGGRGADVRARQGLVQAPKDFKTESFQPKGKKFVPPSDPQELARAQQEVPFANYNRGEGGGGGAMMPYPGDSNAVEDSQLVHEEIKHLAAEAKQIIKKNFNRHGTSRDQVVFGVKQFGVSEQSKKMMAREASAATMAHDIGVYGVYRNEFAKKSSRDFCSRVGPEHRCMCGHLLLDHASPLVTPATAKAGASGGVKKLGVVRKPGPALRPPKCEQCPCQQFMYVPMEPEEVGEHWISRRKEFVPGSWVAKCKCGHAHNLHSSSSNRGRKCTACKQCFQFESNFLCLMCDEKWEAHETIFESEAQRRSQGLPVAHDFFPFSAPEDWEVRDIVFAPASSSAKAIRQGQPGVDYEVQELQASDDEEEGQVQAVGQQKKRNAQASRVPPPLEEYDGVLIPPQGAGGRDGAAQVFQTRLDKTQRARDASFTNNGNNLAEVHQSSSLHQHRLQQQQQPPPPMGSGVLPEYCPSCATIFKSAAAKFCGKCGAPRKV